MKYKVPFIKPNFPSVDEIAIDYAKILSNNRFTNFGPFERNFAKEIGAYIGEGYYAATFSSATAGLIASIITVLGKGDGTKYIVIPAFTFPAGADAILLCGYQPIFVDIENSGFHMDINSAEALLNDQKYSGKIGGILFCNAFGVGTTNIEAWETLSKKTDVPLIIDSAAGFGSLYSETRKVGSAGICEVFSFHATKPFAIGEGGAVVSKNEELIKSVQAVQNFGFDQKRNTTQLGLNGKLQEINAAIGLRQFQNFNKRLQNRKTVFKKYATELNRERFRVQQNAENASLCFAAVVVKKADDRDKYLSMLQKAGIDAKTYYNPSLHKQEYFMSYKSYSPLYNTDLIDASVLSLPIHDNMKQEDITLTIRILNS